MKRFGLETVFFAVVLPLCMVLSAIFAVSGILLLPVDLAWKAFPWRWETWGSIRMIWQVIYRHLHYIWRVDLRPCWRSWQDSRAENRRSRRTARDDAAAHQVFLRETEREQWVLVGNQSEVRNTYLVFARRHAARTALDNLDVVDVLPAVYLLSNLTPFLFVLPHLIIVASGILAVSMTVNVIYGPVEMESEPLSPVRVEFEPQIEDQQEAIYGPWLVLGDVSYEQAADPNFQNLALLSDTGTVRYSTHLQGADQGFVRCHFSDRILTSRLTVNGRIEFEDSRRNRFSVNPEQVFLFEGYRSRAFRFQSNGNLEWVRLENLETEEIDRVRERPFISEGN